MNRFMKIATIVIFLALNSFPLLGAGFPSEAEFFYGISIDDHSKTLSVEKRKSTVVKPCDTIKPECFFGYTSGASE